MALNYARGVAPAGVVITDFNPLALRVYRLLAFPHEMSQGFRYTKPYFCL